MSIRVIRKEVGQTVREKLRTQFQSRGLAVLEQPTDATAMFREIQSAVEPQPAAYEITVLQDALWHKIPQKLLTLAGKLPAPHLFEQVMRPLALASYGGMPFRVAQWAVESWVEALREHLPAACLRFGQTGQDRSAYLELRKSNRPRLPKIEAKIKEKFGIQLAPTKIGRREDGSRILGRGWCLEYSFGRSADGREYVNWSHDHRNSICNTWGRIYEDGEEDPMGCGGSH